MSLADVGSSWCQTKVTTMRTKIAHMPGWSTSLLPVVRFWPSGVRSIVMEVNMALFGYLHVAVETACNAEVWFCLVDWSDEPVRRLWWGHLLQWRCRSRFCSLSNLPHAYQQPSFNPTSPKSSTPSKMNLTKIIAHLAVLSAVMGSLTEAGNTEAPTATTSPMYRQ